MHREDRFLISRKQFAVDLSSLHTQTRDRYDEACDRTGEMHDEIVKLRRKAESLEDQLSDARHERDTARKDAREARRETAALITGDRSDVLHWAARQLRKTPIPTALTGPYWYGKGWEEAINYLEHDLGGLPTDAQVELVEQAEEIGRLQALADRLRLAWKSARRGRAQQRDALREAMAADRARILAVVNEWVIDASEYGGTDHGDLIRALEAAGYTLPGADDEGNDR